MLKVSILAYTVNKKTTYQQKILAETKTETFFKKLTITPKTFFLLYETIFVKNTVVILINATKQFWYVLQNPKWRNK